MSPLALFPVMVLSVAGLGIALIAWREGRVGLRRVLDEERRWRVPARFYLAPLLPPACIAVTLLVMSLAVSRAFAPQLFAIGFIFGIVAGFFEELFWSAFAYPRLAAWLGPLPGSAVLGVAWAVWHTPVVDALGAASQHGAALPAFFAAFALVLVSLRVLIAWVYRSSGSLLLAQLTHASSTAFLVVLGPPHVTASQEAAWYAVYGLLLGAAALTIALAAPVGFLGTSRGTVGEQA